LVEKGLSLKTQAEGGGRILNLAGPMVYRARGCLRKTFFREGGAVYRGKESSSAKCMLPEGLLWVAAIRSGRATLVEKNEIIRS